MNIDVECDKIGQKNGTHFFTATAIEPALHLHFEVIALALSPILLASSALVNDHVAHTEHLPGAVDTGGTLPAGSKVSIAVGIEVVSVRGAGALEMGRSKCEFVATAAECSKPGAGVAFSAEVLEIGRSECKLVVTTAECSKSGEGVAFSAGVNQETCMTGRVCPLLSPMSTEGS